MGASVALPWLEAMAPAGRRAWAQAKARLVVLFKPNGTYMKSYLPAQVGAGWSLTPTLEPLAPWKGQLTIVSGLQNEIAKPHANLHMAGISAWLTGFHPTPGKNGVSLDQVIAGAPGWRGATTFPSLELGGDSASPLVKGGSGEYEGLPKTYGLTTSFGPTGAPRPTEVNPAALFDRLFAGVPGAPAPAPGQVPPGAASPTAAALERRRLYRTSVLDVVRKQADALKVKLGTSDRRRLDGYLAAVRELEQQLQSAAPPPGGGAPVRPAIMAGPACAPGARPAQPPAYPDRLKTMLDLVALALACDRTRVVSLLMAEAESENPFTFLNIKTPTSGDKGHHGASHYGENPGMIASYERIDRFYSEQVAHLVGKLAGVQEGSGSLLDNALVVFGSEVSDGDSHSFQNMPVVLAGRAGGALAPGRHVAVAGNRPLADLWLALQHLLGVQAASFGNSTGPVSLA
jgi:hypothetical protein